VNLTLHILDPQSQHPVTLYGGSLSWLKESPTLEGGGQWKSTHAAIFRSYRRDLFRRLSYVALLADEVQVEQPLKKLQQALNGRDVPSGVVLLPPDEERAVFNSMAVHPESELRVSLKRRIAKAFEKTGRGGNALSTYVTDREEWAEILDRYFMEAHEAREGCGLVVNQALLGLYPTWLSDRIGDSRMLKCVSLAVQFPLAFTECAKAVQECTRKVARALSLCRSSITRPGLQFYKEILPEFTALQHEFRIAGPSATVTLMCVGDVREREVRIPLLALELYENPEYELELRDGTTVYLTVPPWKLGQTIPPREGDYEIKLVEQ
jgi:hypothetical protein